MTTNFLSSFMRVAVQTTGADRAMACDTHLAVIDSLNLDQMDVLSQEITEVVERALKSGQIVVSNNVVKDSDTAPVTNISFDSLRGIVVLPIPGHGAIYLDRPVKQGIIERGKVEKLAKLAEQAGANGQITEQKLREMLRQLG
jgi:hypothetical protein